MAQSLCLAIAENGWSRAADLRVNKCLETRMKHGMNTDIIRVSFVFNPWLAPALSVV